MEMTDRYVYWATKRLPETQRKDIEDELRGLIGDMLDERVQNKQVTEKDVKEVLLELGHPRSLARKYRDDKKYLIGPELYDLFMLVSKVILVSVVTVLTAIFVIQIIISPVHILDHFVNFLVSFFTTIPMAVGWTIIGFVLAEYFSEGSLKNLKFAKGWDPSKLAPVPNPNRQVKQYEPIVGIIVYVLIVMILAFSNKYFGVWILQEGEISRVVPFLNDGAYGEFLLLILAVFGFGIVKECLKLFYERWNYSLVVFTGIVNLISIVLILFLVTRDHLWNPNFMNELVQNGLATKGSEGYQTIQFIWEHLTFWILALLVIGLICDVVAGFIKIRKAKKQ